MDESERRSLAERYRALYPVPPRPLLDRQRVEHGFSLLNEALRQDNTHATINLVGGAVLMLVHEIRPMTEDVDAWIAPDNYIESHILAVGRVLGQERWLNEDALCYFPDRHPGKGVWEPWLILSNLTVQTADPRTLFAMKATALRNAKDRLDLRYLAELIGVSTFDQAHAIIRAFYRDNSIPAERLGRLRELFDV